MYLFEQKALECLDECFKLKVKSTEELEDLIFHIKAYKSIPFVIMETKYPELKDSKDIKNSSKFKDFILEVEKQRAVERDFIFEGAKVLTFDFDIFSHF